MLSVLNRNGQPTIRPLHINWVIDQQKRYEKQRGWQKPMFIEDADLRRFYDMAPSNAYWCGFRAWRVLQALNIKPQYDKFKSTHVQAFVEIAQKHPHHIALVEGLVRGYDFADKTHKAFVHYYWIEQQVLRHALRSFKMKNLGFVM